MVANDHTVGLNFKLVYCRDTEAKKRQNFFGEKNLRPGDNRHDDVCLS